MAERVYIFDTTLRDGEQAAGIAYAQEDKIEIARQLERLGVDIIEAGFAASSPGDFDCVAAIAREVRGSRIASLARTVEQDVDLAWRAIEHAEAPRIHVFVSSSDIHIMHMLQKDREQVLDQAVAMVKRARGYVPDVEFSPQDATRTQPEYLYRMLEAVIDAGATTVNIPDTVGYAIPDEFAEFIRGVFENVPNIDKARVSVHCHNDLGLATANSLAAVRVGARQVEVCVNGIGERAGNASMEEVVMALKTRRDHLDVEIGIDSTQIYRTSKLVERLSGFTMQPNKAIVGRNAFRHQSGIHQDGILKLRQTYEIMDPKEIGIPDGTQLVLGKLSGRHAFRKRLEEMGYELTQEELNRAFLAFKQLADRKRDIDDRDLEAIVADKMRSNESAYRLEMVQVTCGTEGQPTATVKLVTPGGQVVADAALGDGPVDAVYRAINRVVNVENRLTEFSVKSVTEGIDAQGEVTIRIERDGRTFTGRSADTDIVVASARAYMDALNRLILAQSRSNGGTRPATVLRETTP